MDFISLFEEAKTGDIFLSRGKGLLSKLICLVLRSKISHTFVKASDTTVIESNDFGVEELPANKVLKRCAYIKKLGFPGGESARLLFISNLRFLKGAPYDWGILLGGLLSRIWHRSRKLPMPLDDQKSYTCSELVSTALQRCGFELPFPPSQMTPEDLDRYVSKFTHKGLV